MIISTGQYSKEIIAILVVKLGNMTADTRIRSSINMSMSITSQLSDKAIYQILEIIGSEIKDIDDKELVIQLLED